MERGGSRLPRWRVALWGGVATGLVAPLAAMAVAGETGWGLEDLVAAAALLGGSALAVEGAMRGLRRRGARRAAVAAIGAALLLVWAELAVGLLH